MIVRVFRRRGEPTIVRIDSRFLYYHCPRKPGKAKRWPRDQVTVVRESEPTSKGGTDRDVEIVLKERNGPRTLHLAGTRIDWDRRRVVQALNDALTTSAPAKT